jgi:hypothetical protein
VFWAFVTPLLAFLYDWRGCTALDTLYFALKLTPKAFALIIHSNQAFANDQTVSNRTTTRMAKLAVVRSKWSYYVLHYSKSREQQACAECHQLRGALWHGPTPSRRSLTAPHNIATIDISADIGRLIRPGGSTCGHYHSGTDQTGCLLVQISLVLCALLVSGYAAESGELLRSLQAQQSEGNSCALPRCP